MTTILIEKLPIMVGIILTVTVIYICIVFIMYYVGKNNMPGIEDEEK